MGHVYQCHKSKILTVGEQKSSNQPSINATEQTPRRDGVLTLYLGSEIGQSISVEREVLARLEKAGKVLLEYCH